jgi:hypothetical protein
MDKEKLIIGAVAGDIIGSVYEFKNVKRVDFDVDFDLCRRGLMARLQHMDNSVEPA